MREGWKSSSASSFSPVPISLIGLPVTARIESAAPPRPSPSTRVSTMPVRPTRSSNARARLTASWPVSASATSSTSCGFAACFTLAASAIISSSSVVRPAVSSITTSKPPRRPASSARRAICGGVWPSTIGSVSTLTCRPSTASCSIAAGTARVERGHQHLALALLGQAPRDLRRRGGFARALQADHHDGDRRRRIQVDRIGVRAERLDQLVVHELDDHLARRDRLDHRDADRVLLHLLDERAHHIERDVRLEQRTAHLAHRRVDVGLRSARRAASGDREFPPSRSDRLSNMRSPRPRRPFTKHFRARGRIALSGGGRRPLGPVGELALRSLARAARRVRTEARE